MSWEMGMSQMNAESMLFCGSDGHHRWSFTVCYVSLKLLIFFMFERQSPVRTGVQQCGKKNKTEGHNQFKDMENVRDQEV